MQPLVTEISYQDPVALFKHFARQPWAILLDSAQISDDKGRYSFIALDPFQTLCSKDNKIILNEKTILGNPFLVLQAELKKYIVTSSVDLPPFQGGVAGYFAYELSQHLEPKVQLKRNEQDTWDMMLGFYDCVIAFDQQLKKAWIIATGMPELEFASRKTRAQQRTQFLLSKLLNASSTEAAKKKNNAVNIECNLSDAMYQSIVKKIIDYIYAGDVYQVNVAQRFTAKIDHDYDVFALYQQIRKINPAPYAAYFNFPNHVLASVSPEQFLRVRNRCVTTKPIKGTRPRGQNKEQDLANIKALLESNKDQAENLMIVDLLRNDLAKVCQHHSIQVTELAHLETHPTVHHLVSTIKGQLRDDCDLIDLIQATFPGGSITGAPKIRAMEIIAELEPNARGAYCGSMGYIGFDGGMDTAIVIRSLIITPDQISFHAGAGIVADSSPAAEYAETWDKARALYNALIQV